MLRRILVTAVAVVVVGSVAPARAATLEPLKTGPADQFGPSAEGDAWLGWSQYTDRLYTARAEPLPVGGGDTQNLRRRDGAHTFFGDFDPNGEKAIFQDAKGSDSNVYLGNRATGGTSLPPSAINTRYWEWAPEMSTAFILFGRNNFTRATSRWKVMLYDRLAHTLTTLDHVENRCGCIWPEDVNERYVAWTKCVARCNVFVYDTVTDGETKVPNPDRQQYAAALSEDGTVYFVRSGNTCGGNARIRSWNLALGGPASLVYAFPSGTNLAWALDLVDGVDADDLYFDQASCSDLRFRGDVYRLVDVSVDPLRPAVREPAGGGRANGGAWRGPPRPGARPIG